MIEWNELDGSKTWTSSDITKDYNQQVWDLLRKAEGQENSPYWDTASGRRFSRELSPDV
jgi:hypothetical protein